MSLLYIHLSANFSFLTLIHHFFKGLDTVTWIEIALSFLVPITGIENSAVAHF
jgi:hypothetical protein